MKGWFVFLVLIFMAFIGISQPVEVCSGCKYNSLGNAIKWAQPNDTLLVKKGTYIEYNIKVDKPLVIIGENYPIIDGQFKGEVLTIVSDGVTIDGLFIINVGTSYTEDYAAIRVKKSKNFVIRNVVLEKLFFGIYLEKSSYGKVYHNKIIGIIYDFEDEVVTYTISGSVYEENPLT